MSVNLELHFDASSDQRIGTMWQDLKDSGFQNKLLDLPYRPHVTLASADLLEVEAFDGEARQHCLQMRPFDLDFTALSTFGPSSGFIFLAPAANGDLNNLHLKLAEIFENHATEVSLYYQPGRWTPHCTLASGLSPQELMPCFETAATFTLPFPVRVVSAGLVQYPSCDDLAEYSLGSSVI